MLIDETTLKTLPPLYEQEDSDDPTIYAKLATPGDAWACYIAEYGKKNGEDVIFGLFVSKKWGYNWAQISLAEIERDLRGANLEARLAPNFTRASASSLTTIRRRIQHVTRELHAM